MDLDPLVTMFKSNLKKTKIFKNKRAMIAPPKWVGQSNGQKRLFITILVAEKSWFYEEIHKKNFLLESTIIY